MGSAEKSGLSNLFGEGRDPMTELALNHPKDAPMLPENIGFTLTKERIPS